MSKIVFLSILKEDSSVKNPYSNEIEIFPGFVDSPREVFKEMKTDAL